MKYVNEYKKGPKGVAKVRVNRKANKVGVFFENEHEERQFDLSDCPDYVQPGKFFVQLSQDETEIDYMKPLDGSLEVKFVDFSHKENEAPAPRKVEARAVTANGKNFTVPEHFEFTANLRVVDKNMYTGMPINVFFHYLFENDGEDFVQIRGKGKNAELLASFLNAAMGDIAEISMKFSPNILPALMNKLIKKAKSGHTFRVVLDGKGYAQSFLEVFKVDDEEDDDEVPATTKDNLDDEEDNAGKKIPAGKSPWDDDEEDED